MLRTNEEVNRFLDRPKTHFPDEVGHFIKRVNNSISNNETIYWAIALKEDEKLIGAITYWNISVQNDMAEIGFELHPDFQGKGIMQEAMSAVLSFGFNNMHLRTIEAYTHPDNVGSIKVLERNGFEKKTGHDTGGEIIYTLTHS
jgi:ribosomal-protein-alanine N-acetyltransferase